MKGRRPGAPGVFGKLPARADFVLRGLPASFADPWHDWLARGLAAARHELGRQFAPAYMAAPVWRFVLAPGLCGPAPVAGVLLPSVDATGRLFPLTLAAVLPPFGGLPAPAAASGWFEALEEAGREAIDCGPEIEAWLLRLAELAPPPLPSPGVAGDGRGAAPPHRNGGSRPPVRPGGPEGSRAGGAARLWCEGSPFVRACALPALPLPEGACFARLIADAAAPEGAP
jgi:type VI secretion system protein ImpM